MSERSKSDRIQSRVIRAILKNFGGYAPRLLPEHTRLVDGLTLAPELQLMLKLRELQGGRSWSELSIPHARAQMAQECRISGGDKLAVGPVRTFEIPGPTGPMRVRHYMPTELGKRPLMVFFHGGGFLFGDLNTHDQPCRYFAKYAGVQVLSVEYRLAPDNPFPAAVDDAFAGYVWALEHADRLGADASQILVCGDSAGANLAAVVAQLALIEKKQTPALQVLLYPCLDRTVERASLQLFKQGFFLTRRDIDYCLENYARGEDPHDIRLAPDRFPDLASVSPAYVVTCGFDPLRDEGEAYEAALRKAGVVTRFQRIPDLIHGFINMTGLSPASEAALIAVADQTRNFLSAVRPS